ncbi:hypothetical protein AAHC03_016757 [Spirometra sp. Aus1]
MREFWKCECNLSTYADFISRLREEAVAQLDVNYSLHFDPSQRTPSIDIALDDVECRYLLSSNADGSLHLFDTGNPICGDNGKLTFPKLARIDTIPDNLLTNLRRPAHSGLSPSNCIQWNPVDSGFFITTSLDKTLKIWDTNRLECVDLIETAEPMSWAALSTVAVEHNLIAVALTQSCDRQAILVDPIVGAPAISLRGGHTDSHLSQIIWSMRSSFIVITAGHDGRILFWDIRLPSKPIDSLDNASAPGRPSYSHDAVAHNGPVLGLTHSPDGLHLISWGGTGLKSSKTLKLWGLDANGRPCSLAHPNGSPESTSFYGLTSFTDCQPRSLNFGVFSSRTTLPPISRRPGGDGTRGTNSNSETDVGATTLLGSSVRMAVAAAGSSHSLWGATAAFVFVPVGLNLLVTMATAQEDFHQRLHKRHFSDVRACVWNEARQEVYTAGMDNNLHVWSFFPDPVEDPPGSGNDEDATGANFL